MNDRKEKMNVLLNELDKDIEALQSPLSNDGQISEHSREVYYQNVITKMEGVISKVQSQTAYLQALLAGE